MAKLKSTAFAPRLALFLVLLAFIVVVLGAYTRLADAGLGCPDWPGCYGQLTVPRTDQAIQQAQLAFPAAPVEEEKAWTEMVHRYVAGFLGLSILVLALLSIRRRTHNNAPKILPWLIVGLVVLQALLGMWTVTLRLLPSVVMAHLLGGFTILSLLWWQALAWRDAFKNSVSVQAKKFRFWAMLGLVLLALQIALGGWTSANYAALACPDFPYCQGKLLPPMSFVNVFNLFPAMIDSFQGGHLDNIARVTIHMLHRMGAVVVGLYLIGLTVAIIRNSHNVLLSRISWVIILLLLLQISLGILNVYLLLPLWVAVAHNGVAALLLLALVTLNYSLYVRPERSVL